MQHVHHLITAYQICQSSISAVLSRPSTHNAPVWEFPLPIIPCFQYCLSLWKQDRSHKVALFLSEVDILPLPTAKII